MITVKSPRACCGSDRSAGLAPGFVELYQVNLRVPAGVSRRGTVPLLLTQAGVSSNTVTLAAR
jgi:uncharacterized protein (TIGR03437 family)